VLGDIIEIFEHGILPRKSEVKPVRPSPSIKTSRRRK
jgi:hypothetical protein